MVRLSFSGMMAPVFAPFKKDGSLNLEVIPAYAKHLRLGGVTGVWVNGTAGEGLSMTVTERKAVTEAWLSCRRDLPFVIVQCGGVSLKDTKDMASHAEAAGAEGVAVLPDLYNKPRTTDELVDYVEEVATACPNTPLLYYHIPMKTDVNLSMSEFLTKGVVRVPSLSGVKFTDKYVSDEGKRCLQVDGSSLTIFNGFDETLQEALGVGFTSAVTSSFNLFPHLCSQIFSMMEARNEGEAKRIQDLLVRYMEVIFKQTGGFSVSSIKAAGSLLMGLDLGPTRLPVKPFTDSMIQNLRTDLKNLGLKVY